MMAIDEIDLQRITRWYWKYDVWFERSSVVGGKQGAGAWVSKMQAGTKLLQILVASHHWRHSLLTMNVLAGFMLASNSIQIDRS